ncbi:MAG TPA: alpha/beta hydrolase [Chitinophagaceae bacterium]|nr:alpha/beta hydrolase [Chitinophagaceae bacterium]
MFKKKWQRYTLFILAVLTVVYLLGPHPKTPVYSATMPPVPADAGTLQQYIQQQEAQHRIKPGNEARIIWYNDTTRAKTEYSIVYLHGFSASQAEGAPIHTNIAKEFGCNLYLSRLAEHGIDTADPMINITPEKYWESAKQALAIGKQIGKKVILMGTSTGGTNALQLAAAYPRDVAALVLMSPNIAIHDPNAWILNNPWGLQIARLVKGSHYVTATDDRPVYKQYWYNRYPLEAAVALEELLETTMTKETFEKVKQPVLMLYYYKDEDHQDSVVSVPALLKMFDELGTPRQEKIKEAIPNAGDHVLGSYIKSHDLLSVQTAIEHFLLHTLNLTKVAGSSIVEVSK